MSDYERLLERYKELEKRFNNVYKANKQKKEENYKLRGQNMWLLNRCNELTILVNSFTKKKKRRKHG